MNALDVCVFRVGGSFAYWKKGFSSGGSPLTFSFPPRTALVGLIGAILGVDRNGLGDKFPIEETSTAVIPINPIIKDHLPQTWRQGPPTIGRGKVLPSKFKEQFQANLEVVRNPRFNVVFNHRDASIMRDFTKRLEQKRWFYSPYLGSLGFLADVELVETDSAIESSGEEVLIDSVFPLTKERARLIKISPNNSYIREEGVPLEARSGREFRYIDEVYIDNATKSLIVSAKEAKGLRYHHLERMNKNLVFYESCAS